MKTDWARLKARCKDRSGVTVTENLMGFVHGHLWRKATKPGHDFTTTDIIWLTKYLKLTREEVLDIFFPGLWG